MFHSLQLDESDNHANYDVHPSGDRFVFLEQESTNALIGVFRWRALVSDEATGSGVGR